MNQVKLVLPIENMDPNGISVFANTVKMALTGNTNFPISQTYLPGLATARTDLLNAITATVPSAINIKSKVKKVVKLLMFIKANAEYEANDDELKASTSGFAIKQTSVQKPKVFNATQGQLSGTVNLESPYAGTRAGYVWEMIADPIDQNTWQQAKITNTATYTLTGLTPGIKYWFRVKAIVKDEDQPYTDPHMVHVV
ncbi:MAG: fibronectin type III domain-containing protein [Bacteroidota bacterium]